MDKYKILFQSKKKFLLLLGENHKDTKTQRKKTKGTKAGRIKNPLCLRAFVVQIEAKTTKTPRHEEIKEQHLCFRALVVQSRLCFDRLNMTLSS